eukprot:g4339.t1
MPSPEASQGVVAKTAFSDKMRLVFVVGLEGSGHHYLNDVVVGGLCKSDTVKCPDICSLADVWYNKLSTFTNPSEYKDGIEELGKEMEHLSHFANGLRNKTVAVANFAKCGVLKRYHVGEMSFPDYAGRDKPLQHVDLRMLAEEAERAGIDLRLIYLGRASEEILISTTEHRRFGNFAHQARVLINAASVISSSFAELHPDFLTCFSYNNRASSVQASRVAEFVMPTMDSARLLSQIIMDSSVTDRGHREMEEASKQEGWDLVAHRLQRKLDLIERDYC